jgi:hypothetical protein
MVTLILAIGNSDYVIQVSDRRLSSAGKVHHEEYDKSGILTCQNARLAFGFTGIANAPGFNTKKWLLSAIYESGRKEKTIGEILERLRDRATRDFANLRALAALPRSQKCLAIMFSGFIDHDGRYRAGNAILSNFHDFQRNSRFNEAQPKFNISYTSADANVRNPTLVQRVGSWRPMTEAHIFELRSLLEQRKPASALLGKSYSMLRRFSESPKSGNAIGKQLTGIIIPHCLNSPIQSDYSSNVVRRSAYMPSQVVLLPDQMAVIDNIQIRPVETSTPPISVPRTKRGAPCPCGSGKKFKFCHGRK